MSIISAWIIKRPRIRRYCGHYRCQKPLPIGKPQVRIYGNAFYGDPCYAEYLCIDCARTINDKKVQSALSQPTAETPDAP